MKQQFENVQIFPTGEVIILPLTIIAALGGYRQLLNIKQGKRLSAVVLHSQAILAYETGWIEKQKEVNSFFTK